MVFKNKKFAESAEIHYFSEKYTFGVFKKKYQSRRLG